MVTDDERREVARRLRELEPYLFDDDGGECIDCGEVESALGLTNDDGSWYQAEGVKRLADLIEPPAQCPYYHSDRHYCSVHEDMQTIDRDALLALADEIEDNDVTYCVSTQYVLDSYASRIREALGEGES